VKKEAGLRRAAHGNADEHAADLVRFFDQRLCRLIGEGSDAGE
jgi:hypothetical protein